MINNAFPINTITTKWLNLDDDKQTFIRYSENSNNLMIIYGNSTKGMPSQKRKAEYLYCYTFVEFSLTHCTKFIN